MSDRTKRPPQPPRDAWPESATRPLVPPLQPSVVYTAEDPDALDALYEGRAEGFTYAREGHPNAVALARRIDALEGIAGGIVTGSGMSAIAAAILGPLTAGDHVLGGDQLYGQSLRMLRDELPRLGLSASFADATDADAMAAAIRPETRMILVEGVSNPTLRIADLAGIAKLARERGVLLAVDNTFTTPRMSQPFDLGADIVVHSVTKMLAGHSDATLGYVAARDEGIAARIGQFSVTMGLTASPFDCWMAERGLLSFGLRFDRAEATAAALAEALAETAGVRRVLYPTRGDHPEHGRALQLFGGRGGSMVSFEIGGDRAAANAFVRAASGIAFAPTLGDVATTLSHPASSSHRGLTPEGRAALGITEGFFRISVGVEEPDRLIEVFRSAVEAASAAP